MRVCEVVREKLGLSDLCYTYCCDGGPSKCYADLRTYYSGWEVTIRFYDSFYQIPLFRQIEVIVHEHLHAVIHPLDQATMRVEKYLPANRKKHCHELLEVARELTVEHFTAPLYELLEPHILKVL